ncbi:uncharacterized protein BO96DRAFT_404280 [Aspergillus niger CBS 101883]|uniref:uncharacterized protein n=1 Tax=Aspergillus lacticoffeatus (strain CBS 101883) TaxID=1450533 RepID=UPI000D7F2F9A|nr:uncharacterized protein BO96DRAFT_404280 [Aspergillus niger CBS 101883]PYH51300.1 hypothetical protein BO96DRAFT_404280 [Aspergillus niger CBS 101883]
MDQPQSLNQSVFIHPAANVHLQTTHRQAGYSSPAIRQASDQTLNPAGREPQVGGSCSLARHAQPRLSNNNYERTNQLPRSPPACLAGPSLSPAASFGRKSRSAAPRWRPFGQCDCPSVGAYITLVVHAASIEGGMQETVSGPFFRALFVYPSRFSRSQTQCHHQSALVEGLA